MLALVPRLRRFAVGLTRSAADGDDLCQATIERALVNRGKWQEGTRLDSWMYTMMRNIWIDETRARQRRGQTFVSDEAGAAVGQAGIAAAVGTLLAPLAAILPFVSSGMADDANCQALIGSAGKPGAPGQTAADRAPTAKRG